VSDRARFAELASGNSAGWRNLTTAQIEDAGRQEFLKLGLPRRAVDAPGCKAEIIDYVESCLRPWKVRRGNGIQRNCFAAPLLAMM
jgi:hypothetical protein